MNLSFKYLRFTPILPTRQFEMGRGGGRGGYIGPITSMFNVQEESIFIGVLSFYLYFPTLHIMALHIYPIKVQEPAPCRPIPYFIQAHTFHFLIFKYLELINIYVQNTNGALKTINSSRLTVDPEGNLWFSNVTRNDASNEFFYACSAASYFRNEYKLGNRVVLQVGIKRRVEQDFTPGIGLNSRMKQGYTPGRVNSRVGQGYTPGRVKYQVYTSVMVNSRVEQGYTTGRVEKQGVTGLHSRQG